MEGSAGEKNTVNKKEEWSSQEGDRRGHWAEARRKLGSEPVAAGCDGPRPGQGTQASSGEGGPCSWTAESRKPVVEIRSESDWHSLVSCGHLQAPRGSALLRTQVMPQHMPASQCHTLDGTELIKTKLTYILAQGRQFPVLWNLHKTHCPYFVLVLGQEMGLNVLSSFIFKLLVGFWSFQEREYNDKYHWGGNTSPRAGCE